MNGLTMHLLVALVWVFLIGNQTLGGLVGGLLAGYLLLVIFRRALFAENYVRRTNALVSYVFYFLNAVIVSNYRILRLALGKEVKVVGRYIAYDVQGLTMFEVLFLSHCLNLTPGSIVARYSAEKEEIVIHTFSTICVDDIRDGVDEMKARMLRFSR